MTPVCSYGVKQRLYNLGTAGTKILKFSSRADRQQTTRPMHARDTMQHARAPLTTVCARQHRRTQIALYMASSSSRRRLHSISTGLAAKQEEFIPYLRRSHGEHYSPAAVAQLRIPEFGPWEAYYPPVPSCRCGSPGIDVLDFSRGVDAAGHTDGDAAVGKWDEVRRGMYGSESQATQTRDLHIGVDLCGPSGTPVHAFADGEVFLFDCYPGEFDYGNVVVLKHIIDGTAIWSLYGHLSAASISNKVPGHAVKAGEVIGRMGEKHENGNWFPHTHFQISLLEPVIADMPGVVFEGHRETALRVYPDPRAVLGPLW